jgi:hypothetical protein
VITDEQLAADEKLCVEAHLSENGALAAALRLPAYIAALREARDAMITVIEIDRLIGGQPQETACELALHEKDSEMCRTLLRGLGVDVREP